MALFHVEISDLVANVLGMISTLSIGQLIECVSAFFVFENLMGLSCKHAGFELPFFNTLIGESNLSKTLAVDPRGIKRVEARSRVGIAHTASFIK